MFGTSIIRTLTRGRVDAGSDVEVAESVGVRHVAADSLVLVVSALMVRQAASHRGLGHVATGGGVQ